jgi:chemotaxis protein MotB
MPSDSIIIKKKKVVGHAAHHGGSWKVAYADFVTAMMAFFMVLWIMGLSDDTKVAISGYFNDPAGFMKSNPRSKNVISVMNGTSQSRKSSQERSMDEDSAEVKGIKVKDIQEGDEVKAALLKSVEGIPDLKKILEHIEIIVGKEGLRIELLEDLRSVFFESGSTSISPEGQKIIAKLAPVLKKTGRFIVVEGHTDRKPYAGSIYTNWELSAGRATSMRQQLAKDGIPVERFRAITGFADTRLRVANKPFDPTNRRVSLRTIK